MLRRIQRKRREYLYEKSLEGAEWAQFEKKGRVRESLEEGKPIPTELRNEEHELRRQIDVDDQKRAVPRNKIDDEYATAATREPKILLTTSRSPSSPLTQFVKELKVVFPNSQRMNRGGQVTSEIVESCRSHKITDLILVHEHRGQPDGLVVCHLPASCLRKTWRPESIELKEVGPCFELRLYRVRPNASIQPLALLEAAMDIIPVGINMLLLSGGSNKEPWNKTKRRTTLTTALH